MWPNSTRYPSRSTAESQLETHITEHRFGEQALFACLDDSERNQVIADVEYMLSIMEACGYFEEVAPVRAQ